MSTVPSAGDGEGAETEPAKDRLPHPPLVPEDEFWRPPPPGVGTPPPSLLPSFGEGIPAPSAVRQTSWSDAAARARRRLDPVPSDAWWNGWEWRWDVPGELLGDIPWPFLIRPATVTWARLLCVLQGTLGMLGGVVITFLLVRSTRDGTYSAATGSFVAVQVATLLGFSGLTIMFGGALRTMSRDIRLVVTVMECLQIAAAVIWIWMTHQTVASAGLLVPPVVLVLLWAHPHTRRCFTTSGKRVPGPDGDDAIKVVSPRRLRGQVPDHPPGPPVHGPPPRPQPRR